MATQAATALSCGNMYTRMHRRHCTQQPPSIAASYTSSTALMQPSFSGLFVTCKSSRDKRAGRGAGHAELTRMSDAVSGGKLHSCNTLPLMGANSSARLCYIVLCAYTYKPTLPCTLRTCAYTKPTHQQSKPHTHQQQGSQAYHVATFNRRDLPTYYCAPLRQPKTIDHTGFKPDPSGDKTAYSNTKPPACACILHAPTSSVRW